MSNKENIIVRIWKNKKLRSSIFLTFWIVFIIWIYLGIAVPYKRSHFNGENTTSNNTVDNSQSSEIDEKTHFEDLKSSLLKYNFKYVYTVDDGMNKVIYRGTMLKNETLGYKESADGIEKYIVRGTNVYKDVMGEITVEYDKTIDVYNGYLNVDKVLEMIHGVEYIKTGNEYNFEINNIYVKIIEDNDNIASILIVANDVNYLLEFDEVNEVTELND